MNRIGHYIKRLRSRKRQPTELLINGSVYIYIWINESFSYSLIIYYSYERLITYTEVSSAIRPSKNFVIDFVQKYFLDARRSYTKKCLKLQNA
jgi:hypothetical protein